MRAGVATHENALDLLYVLVTAQCTVHSRDEFARDMFQTCCCACRGLVNVRKVWCALVRAEVATHENAPDLLGICKRVCLLSLLPLLPLDVIEVAVVVASIAAAVAAQPLQHEAEYGQGNCSEIKYTKR